MNYDVDKYITNLTVMELKAIIKECLREDAEEKNFSETQEKALWLKQPVLHKVLNARPIETEIMPKPITYEFYGPPWRYLKPRPWR